MTYIKYFSLGVKHQIVDKLIHVRQMKQFLTKAVIQKVLNHGQITVAYGKWSCCFWFVSSIAMATKENLQAQKGFLGSISQKVNAISSILFVVTKIQA